MEIKTIKTKELLLRTAKTVSEALPFIQRFAGHTFVIKYGGNAMGNERTAETFARDIVVLKTVGINPVVVHGGGPQIGAMLERLKIHSEFIDGLRVTDQSAVEIVEMVLSGSINKQLVTALNQAGGTAIGISGKDGNLIEAQQLRRTKKDPDSNIERVLDLGFVGEPTKINPRAIEHIIASGMIPVIAPHMMSGSTPRCIACGGTQWMRPKPVKMLSGSGTERSWIQPMNGACRISMVTNSTRYSARKIGIWIRIGRQPLTGFTFSRL